MKKLLFLLALALSYCAQAHAQPSITINGQNCYINQPCTIPTQASINFTTNGTSGPATYNPVTGALNIPNYATSGNAINGLSGDCTVSGSSGTVPITCTKSAGVVFGTAAFTASSAYDVSGAASAALASAETYASNASNLNTGTVSVARLPVGIPSANLNNNSIAVNGVTCILGSSCSPPALQPNNNLSDVGSAATSRANLGLGTAATHGPTISINSQPCTLDSSCTVSGSGTGTVNSGTANQLAFYSANGTTVSGDSNLTDNGTTLGYAGSGGISTPIVTTGVGGAIPGAQSLVANSGNYNALPANSAGFGAPPTGGTSYLIQLPATATAGCMSVAAPTTVAGVNVAVASYVACGSSIAKTTITVPATAIAANACASTGITITVTGLTTSSILQFTPGAGADLRAVTGYGPSSAGQIYFVPILSAGSAVIYPCNATSSSLTPGSSEVWNVGVIL